MTVATSTINPTKRTSQAVASPATRATPDVSAATQTTAFTPATFPHDPDVGVLPLIRLSVEQYDRIVDAGILSPDDRCELIEGLLVYKMSEGSEHSAVISIINEYFVRRLPPGWSVRIQHPAPTADSSPEPDVTIVRGSPRDYLRAHPRPDQTGLVVEVSQTTLRYDRQSKLRVYARGGIQNYWIVDLNDNVVEVFTDPTGESATPEYRSHTVHRSGDALTLRLDDQTVTLPAADLLP